jgi:hypothetical protein
VSAGVYVRGSVATGYRVRTTPVRRPEFPAVLTCFSWSMLNLSMPIPLGLAAARSAREILMAGFSLDKKPKVCESVGTHRRTSATFRLV